MSILVKRIHLFSGKEVEREIDITPAQLHEVERGLRPIQSIVPHLSASDREFLMTGLGDEEWDGVINCEEAEDPLASGPLVF